MNIFEEKTKIKKYSIISLFLFILIFANQALSSENRILYKVNNKIITTLDINDELKYLSAMNPKILDLDNNEILKIVENSILRQKIKEIEINKQNLNKKIDEELIQNSLKQNYQRIGLLNEEEFYSYLKNNDLNITKFIEKLSIEILWNRLIFKKYIEKINIDKNEIKKKILETSQKNIINYDLSEIVFNLNNSERLEDKIIFLKNEIKKEGFEKTALIYSVSDSNKNGGRLGWVSEESININIKNILNNLKIGDYSEVITLPGGFLILKINDKKYVTRKENLNINEEIDNQVKIKTNDLLNQYSNIYFNKIKKNIKIEKF